MAQRYSFASFHPGLLLLALAIAIFLWGIASGTSSAERGFDVPVELTGLAEDLVVTDQSADSINIRVMGSRAALRNVTVDRYTYAIDVSGGKPGVAVYDVDVSRIDWPRGARPVSRSPSRVQVRFEKRGRKSVTVRADLEGELPPGYRLVEVRVNPPKLWLEGARSQVMRLKEIVTEPINLSGLKADEEKEVRINLGGGTVWLEDTTPVNVLVRVEAEQVEAPAAGPEDRSLNDGAGAG